MTSKKNTTTYDFTGTIKLAVNTAFHPFEYAKVLIQIGHEPLAPYPTKTLLGKPALGLPNVIEYVKYMKQVDGFAGCYKGLTSRLLGNSINLITCRTVSSYAEQYAYQVFPPPNFRSSISKRESDKEKWLKLWRSTLVEITGKTVGVIASHPFQVITLRIMAQFVGGESQYDGIFSSIGQIYRTEGILGFFAGLIPRLLAELILTTFINVCIFLTENYFNTSENDITKFSSIPIAVVGTALTYPFHVVSTCMAVNNSGIAAGNPPQMPIYSSWIECWKHLSRTDQLSRGSSMFFRYHKGVHVSTTGYQNFLVKKDY